jgi:hypothetical protein
LKITVTPSFLSWNYLLLIILQYGKIFKKEKQRRTLLYYIQSITSNEFSGDDNGDAFVYYMMIWDYMMLLLVISIWLVGRGMESYGRLKDG